MKIPSNNADSPKGSQCEKGILVDSGRLRLIPILAVLITVSGCKDMKDAMGKMMGDTKTQEQSDTPPQEQEETQPEEQSHSSIPYCRNIKGYKAPGKADFLEGKEKGTVHCIVDGDTFDVTLKRNKNKRVRVRMWGMDCPESSMNSKCMRKGKKACKKENKKGKRASEKVRKMLGNGKVIIEPPYKNNGKRKLAYVRRMSDNIDFGRRLVQDCLCKPGYPHKRRQTYQNDGKRCSEK